MHICVLQIVTQINCFHATLANFCWSTTKVEFKKTTVGKPKFWDKALGKVERTVRKTATKDKKGVTVQKDRITSGQKRDWLYYYFFLPLRFRASASLALQWDTGGPSSAAARRLPACLRVTGTSRGVRGVLGGGGWALEFPAFLLKSTHVQSQT